MKQVIVKFAANFENNLEQIEHYLSEADLPNAFDELLTELGDTVIPNLEHFPQMGRSFLQRSIGSVEVQNGLDVLQKKFSLAEMNDDIREYLLTDYLILYMCVDSGTKKILFLLSIKHHRQLSYNFESLYV